MQHINSGHCEGFKYEDQPSTPLYLIYTRNRNSTGRALRRSGAKFVTLVYADTNGGMFLSDTAVQDAIELPSILAIKTFTTHFIDGKVFGYRLSRLTSSKNTSWGSLSKCSECRTGGLILGTQKDLDERFMQDLNWGTEQVKQGQSPQVVDGYLLSRLNSDPSFRPYIKQKELDIMAG